MLENLPYKPIVPGKTGEITAFAGVSDLRKGEDIQPVFVVPKHVPKTLVALISDNWNSPSPFYLDIQYIQASEALEIMSGLLGHDLRPIVTISPGTPNQLLDVARMFISPNYKRLGVRLPAAVAAAGDCEVRLNYLLRRLGCDAKDTDLFVDFGPIKEEQSFHRANAARVFENLPGFDQWRSVYYAASSFPDTKSPLTLDEIGKDLHSLTITRVEMETYQALQGAGFGRPIGFSDAGVTFFEPPIIPSAPHQPAPNIRYTLSDSFLYIKGKLDPEQPNSDMVRVCKILTRMPEFRRGFCEGDENILRCARGLVKPGTSKQWRNWDHNHHYHTTMDQIGNFA